MGRGESEAFFSWILLCEFNKIWIFQKGSGPILGPRMKCVQREFIFFVSPKASFIVTVPKYESMFSRVVIPNERLTVCNLPLHYGRRTWAMCPFAQFLFHFQCSFFFHVTAPVLNKFYGEWLCHLYMLQSMRWSVPIRSKYHQLKNCPELIKLKLLIFYFI